MGDAQGSSDLAVNYPRTKWVGIVRGAIIRGGVIVLGAIALGGNCPVGNCPGAIFLGSNSPGGNYPEGNCPVPADITFMLLHNDSKLLFDFLTFVKCFFLSKEVIIDENTILVIGQILLIKSLEPFRFFNKLTHSSLVTYFFPA